MNENIKYILAAVGILLCGVFYAAYFHYDALASHFGISMSSEVHVHADFSFYVLGQRVDLREEKYQSSAQRTNHPTMHFHDGVDTMIHRHQEGIILGAFLGSLGFTLTDTCVTFDSGTNYCSDGNDVLKLYVNGKPVSDITNYVTEEGDQILLHFGDPKSPQITTFQEEITDEACLYSGTCPERGDPPFESCGLTCEIKI